MITFDEAKNKVVMLLRSYEQDVKGGLLLLDAQTRTKSYGWVFVYTGKLWFETRDLKHAIAGNGPVVVLSETGEVIPLGTAFPVDVEIEQFEVGRGLSRTDPV